MNRELEQEFNALGGLFHSIVNDMKGIYPALEDFSQKSIKLSVNLKSTLSALNGFLDALQKIADFATNAKGGTRDIGAALTRICLRHRSLENRVRTVSDALAGQLATRLAERADEWRQRAVSLEKHHHRQYKITRGDIKKRQQDAMRLRKRIKKGETRVQPMLDTSMQEINDKYLLLVEEERKLCRTALVEQRAQFCYFVMWFKPVLDFELGLLTEASQLQEVVEVLLKHSAEPTVLPPSSEAVIRDIKGLEHTWKEQFVSPPSSPSSSLSRKSSFCSLSSNETGNYATLTCRNVNGNARNKHPGATTVPAVLTMRTASQPPPSPCRYSSQDSGFVTSQDVVYSSITRKSEGSGSSPDDLPYRLTDGEPKNTCSPSPSSVTWPETIAASPSTPHCAPHPSNSSLFRQPCIPPQVPPKPPLIGQQGSIPSLIGQVRPHTISAAEQQPRRQRMALQRDQFMPMSSAPTASNSGCLSRPMTLGLNAGIGVAGTRPPMRVGSASAMTTPTVLSHQQQQIPDFNAVQPDQLVMQPIYANVADLQRNHSHPPVPAAYRTNSVSSTPMQVNAGGNRELRYSADEAPKARLRPQSFVGDDEDIHRLSQMVGFVLNDRQAFGRSSMRERREELPKDDDEDTLIDDALDQIDQLTSALDQQYYCSSAPSTSISNTTITDELRPFGMANTDSVSNRISGYCTLPRSYQRSPEENFGGSSGLIDYLRSTYQRNESKSRHTLASLNGSGRQSVVSMGSSQSSLLPPSSGGGASRQMKAPPPPVRRNSTITAATPTAPAVDLVRSNSRCTTPVSCEEPQYHYAAAVIQQLNLQQQNSNSSNGTELPPPPAFLLDATSNGASSNVAVSPQFCVAHETLMMQIRSGVSLKNSDIDNGVVDGVNSRAQFYCQND